MNITPVILCGGSGERLWPLSRKEQPKQFLPLFGDNTMLQETILRLNGIENLSDPIIVCNTNHRFLAAKQCHDINISNPTILLEPVGKNTAPAIAAAAIYTLEKKLNTVLLVLSADHIIQNVNAFHRAINEASKLALQDKLVTFGIVPTSPNIGFGYIKASEENIDGAYKVNSFVEKPDLTTAKKYLKKGNYLWNSGMFMFKAQTFIDELKSYCPQIVAAVYKSVSLAEHDIDFVRLAKDAFELSPNDSIDYALMEKSNKVYVVKLDAQWSDIGTWAELYSIGKKDINGNVIEGDVTTIDTTESYINAKYHMVATIGVNNLVIVDTPDVTFISTLEKAKEVKSIVEILKDTSRGEASMHRKVYRPWGWYDSVEAGLYFQVKRLHVNPGAKLSLQMHHKRAEHWVVVSGKASVTNGEEKFLLEEGESTYIPIGVKHSLENNTREHLEIIEVQSGIYLGEDDIVRFEDIYGRLKD
jgi:mannose-1-phosphate guanylyltransferase/mannose-6-phosphate isomerase